MKKESHYGSRVRKRKFFSIAEPKRNQNIVTSAVGNCVTSMDKELNKALEKSYKTISKIEFQGKTFRNDIGLTSREMNVLLRLYPLSFIVKIFKFLDQ